MLEVRPGLLLGSMGDALAVLTRVPSVTKQYSVTHILTVANDPPDYEWSDGGQDDSVEVKGKGAEGQGDSVEGGEGESDGVKGGEGESDGVKGGEGESDSVKGGDKNRGGRGGSLFKMMFVKVRDLPSSDLLHHFESCARFIKEGRQQGTVLVHW